MRIACIYSTVNNQYRIVWACKDVRFSFGVLETNVNDDNELYKFLDFPVNLSKQAVEVTGYSRGKFYYWDYGAQSNQKPYTDLPIQTVDVSFPSSEKIAYVLAYGTDVYVKMNGTPDEILEGIPEEVNSFKYPDEGITPDVNYYDFASEEEPTPDPEPVIPRPENPYNPEDETGSPEWREETEQNIMPLTKIEYDKLFPFSMVASLPKLTSKMNVLQPDEGVYSSIVLPVPDGNGESAELRLDMTPVHDLLLMVRPLLQVFLVFGLVFALVMFWKSILTGD